MLPDKPVLRTADPPSCAVTTRVGECCREEILHSIYFRVFLYPNILGLLLALAVHPVHSVEELRHGVVGGVSYQEVAAWDC